MPVTVPFKYRAFLSYSHADTDIAARVHRRLERFPLDKEVVGRVTPMGLIPKSLRPIFRDRHDFNAGASLSMQTGIALDGSAALVLLASPRSARSKYVNEEVRLFKARHPERPVIPLIIDGEPGDDKKECFPLAVRFAVAPDGTIVDRPIDVLAADLREKGDGFELALAKVVARLIGLEPDDVFRRAEREQRRQNRLRAAVGAVMIALAIGGGAFFWESHQQKQTLDEIATLVDKYSIVSPANAAVPGARQSLTQAITAIAEGAATDTRYARAIALLKAGKPGEAEPLLKAVAEDKEKSVDKDAKDAAAAYRNLASVAAVSDPRRARDYYAKAARLDPSNVDGMFANGWFQQNAGQINAAQIAYTRVIAMAQPGRNDWALIWAQFGTGDIQQQRGNLDAALTTYLAAQAFAERLAKSDTGNAGWQRDLSVSYEKVGDLQMAQGNLGAALASYQADLFIAERLAKSDPGNAGWQRDLSVSYNKVGDVLVVQGNMDAALASYQASHVIRERLAKSDPGNAGWQRDLLVSYAKIGDVQMTQGNLGAALASYQADLFIAERLAKSDPGNAGWQRDLSVSYAKVGNVHGVQGNLGAALDSYQAEFSIAERLAKSDTGNAGWQRDLSVSYNDVGNVQVAQGNLGAALGSYQAEFSIIERLAKSDPGNAGWQRDLSVSYAKVGDVQLAQGNLDAALGSHKVSLAIAERLAKSDPSNAGWQHDLAVSYSKLGDQYSRSNDPDNALAALRQGQTIMDRLAKRSPDNILWKRDVRLFNDQITALTTRRQSISRLRPRGDVIQQPQRRSLGQAKAPPIIPP